MYLGTLSPTFSKNFTPVTDKETKHVQWHFPTTSEAKDPLKAKRRAEMAAEREEQKQPARSAAG